MKSVNSCQISIMFKDYLPNTYDFEALESIIVNSFSGINQKVPIPIPKEQWITFPTEIPRLIYQTEQYVLQVSPESIAFIIKNILDDAALTRSLQEYSKNLDCVLNFISEKYKLDYRLGIILEIKATEAELMASLKKHLKDEALNNKQEIEFSMLDVKDNNPKKINLWSRYLYNKTNGSYKYILDGNLSPSTPARLGDETIETIYQTYLKDLMENKYVNL